MKTKLSLLIIFVISLIILTKGINKPFIGHHDWNGVQYANIARNHLRYGIFTTKLGSIENAGIITANYSFNTHYPAAFPFLLSGSFFIFGISEWSARIVPILFSLAAVLLTFVLSEKLIGERSGIIAAIFLVSTPMFRYFAKMPTHEPVITAIVLGSVLSYYLWQNKKLSWYWFFLTTTYGLIISWPAYFIAPLLFVYDWLKNKKADYKSFSPLFIASILIFVLHLTHNLIVTGDPFGGGLLQILSFRLNILSPDQAQLHNFTLTEFLKQEITWIQIFFTKIQTYLALMFLAFYIVRIKFRHQKGLIIILLIYGITYALIFRNAAFIHEYMIYYLAPGIALAATAAIAKITGILVKKKTKLKIILSYLFILSVLIFSFIERNKFYLALENSNMHLIGKRVGEEIASITSIDQKISAHSLPYSSIYSKFTAFYADRNIVYFNKNKYPSPPVADYEVLIKQYLPKNFDRSLYNEGEHIFWRKLVL